MNPTLIVDSRLTSSPHPAHVQDVGLIFLSAMATSIAHASTAEGFREHIIKSLIPD